MTRPARHLFSWGVLGITTLLRGVLRCEGAMKGKRERRKEREERKRRKMVTPKGMKLFTVLYDGFGLHIRISSYPYPAQY